MILSLALCAGSASAQEPLDLKIEKPARFEFSDTILGGFERKKLNRDVRLRGWNVGNGIYIGQAKFAKKWGLGFVYENGDTVYGLNNRGIQVLKRF
ncbi:MAG: hypothetical protein HOE54_02380 [Gammaproteobacteria bacterium]|nr:hypothetical protein [Gammaproteobacteria bacterium]